VEPVLTNTKIIPTTLPISVPTNS